MAELPITNLCIVSDKKNCPPSYTLLDRTMDNDDGDFWKDKFFKAKTLRYICYTKEVDENPVQQVVTDLAIVGSKDPTPNGYTALAVTSDTREQALRKQVLCVRYVAKSMTNAAVTDVCLFKDNSYRERMYTLAGEVNGINLTFKLGTIILPARSAPPIPLRPAPIVPTSNIESYHHNTSTTYASLQRQTSKPMTGIEGVPFKLNERYAKAASGSSPNDQPLPVTIRSPAEISSLTAYDFSQERTVVGS